MARSECNSARENKENAVLKSDCVLQVCMLLPDAEQSDIHRPSDGCGPAAGNGYHPGWGDDLHLPNRLRLQQVPVRGAGGALVTLRAAGLRPDGNSHREHCVWLWRRHDLVLRLLGHQRAPPGARRPLLRSHPHLLVRHQGAWHLLGHVEHRPQPGRLHRAHLGWNCCAVLRLEVGCVSNGILHPEFSYVLCCPRGVGCSLEQLRAE